MPIDAALVDAFISALDAPTVAKPQMENLGVTSIWLRNNLHLAEKAVSGSFADATPTQKSLFESSFVNPTVMAKVVSSMWALSIGCFFLTSTCCYGVLKGHAGF